MSSTSTSVSFFCRNCRLDQDLEARKSSYRKDEYFWAKCRYCGGKLFRYITERQKDPYYHNSIKLKIQKDKLAVDLIQPGDNRFKLWYQDKWREMEEASQKYEENLKKEKQSRDNFYKEHRHNVTERNAAKAVIEAEERIQYGTN